MAVKANTITAAGFSAMKSLVKEFLRPNRHPATMAPCRRLKAMEK